MFRQEVEMVLKSCAGDFDVVGGVGEVGEDSRVVALYVVGIDAVILDAAIFLNIDLVSVPIGCGSITLVFGVVQSIDPEIVVISFVVGVDAWREVDVVFE